jgi:pimeloyl-ACP methyl ester carboxylesterase
MIQAGNFAALANGITLHYARCGKPGAPLVLFVHGFPEYWGAWEDVLPSFADGYYAVAPDLRGFNLSSQPADVAAYRAREIVGDLAQLIDHLGYANAYVVAHDWGGAAAWQLAIAQPRRVRKLAILNSPHPIPFARDLADDPAQQAASGYMNRLREPDAEDVLARDGYVRLFEIFEKSGRRDLQWLTPQRRQRYREVWTRGLTGALNYYRATPLYPPTDRDPGARAPTLDPRQFIVRVPTLVLWGMRDTALLPGLLDGLAELVPDLTIERFADATHWIAHEEPAAVAEHLRAFFAAP